MVPQIRVGTWGRVLIPALMAMALWTPWSPANAVVQKNDPVVEYRSRLNNFKVRTIDRKPITTSLKDLSGGYKRVLLYFWSARDPRCAEELETLAFFREYNGSNYKVLPVAISVGGDERNNQSRAMAKKYPTLDIMFDEGRLFYDQFCKAERTDTRSVFIIDPTGTVIAARIDKDRETPLGDWLDALLGVPMVGSASVPPDARGRVLEKEIEAAIRLGYMRPVDPKHFRPDQTMTSAEFMHYLRIALEANGAKDRLPVPPSDPKAQATRERVAKLIAVSLLDPGQIDDFIQRMGCSPEEYLQDFRDAGTVTPWATQYLATAIYRGWMPPNAVKTSEGYVTDWTKILPKGAATREYVAALLVRAFPDPKGFTGLIVHTRPFERTPNLQIIGDSSEPEASLVYPDREFRPPHPYFQAPGMISYCENLDVAMKLRVGPRPLEVTATEIIAKPGLPVEIVLSKEDAGRIEAENEKSLFLRSWRVAIIQDAEEPSASSAPSATPE